MWLFLVINHSIEQVPEDGAKVPAYCNTSTLVSSING